MAQEMRSLTNSTSWDRYATTRLFPLFHELYEGVDDAQRLKSRTWNGRGSQKSTDRRCRGSNGQESSRIDVLVGRSVLYGGSGWRRDSTGADLVDFWHVLGTGIRSARAKFIGYCLSVGYCLLDDTCLNESESNHRRMMSLADISNEFRRIVTGKTSIWVVHEHHFSVIDAGFDATVRRCCIGHRVDAVQRHSQLAHVVKIDQGLQVVSRGRGQHDRA